jgi:competence protein ComEC
MGSLIRCVFIIGLFVTTLAARSLDIYFIDVEGGGATLITTPEGESILIDSGWRRDDGRDAHRIVKALHHAGLKDIDYLVTTHFHADHYGSVLRLSQMLKIRNFLDHGPRIGVREAPDFAVMYAEYMRANRGERQTLQAGDKIPVKSGKTPLTITCIASAREVIRKKDVPENPECAKLQLQRDDPSDNAASIALLLQFGKFDFFHGADLTWNVEASLVCPGNLIGQVDAYQVNHHGLKSSNNPVLLNSIAPSVAVIANGPQPKGADPEVFALLKALPSLQDVYQLHLNPRTRKEDNTHPDLIANLGPEAGCEGHWILLSVDEKGESFTVTNGRNGLSKEYKVR